MAFGRKRKDPFGEIQACLQKRDYKGALDWFNTLLQKDRKNTQIRLRFADTLVLAGNKREAVKQYRIVADELADKGFMIRAIAINKKIIQLDPSQTDVHEKLAAMNEERSGARTSATASSSGRTTSLADVLYQPGDPIKRSSDAAASSPSTPAPKAEPEPEPEPQPPAVLPELSLEESMAMEFGTASDMSEAAEEAVKASAPPAEEPIPAPPPADEPIPAPLPAEEPVPASASGGFSLESADSSPANVEPPVFEEEPILIGDDEAPAEADAAETEGEIELAFEGVEPTAESPEIVLDVVEAEAASSSAESDADADADAGAGASEPILLGDEDSQEIEVIAFEVEDPSEPALPAEGVESLMGALGEDIDSLIDSIIDDVGSSAVQAGEDETPAPTHIPLFSDLTSSEFVDIALLLVRRVAKVGETIVRAGDPGDSMFIVSTGEVRATIERDGKQVLVATMKDGDFFGEMAVLSGEPRTATCTAVKATELLELSRENLAEICSRHPHVEAKIRLAYDERVARYQTQ